MKGPTEQCSRVRIFKGFLTAMVVTAAATYAVSVLWRPVNPFVFKDFIYSWTEPQRSYEIIEQTESDADTNMTANTFSLHAREDVLIPYFRQNRIQVTVLTPPARHRVGNKLQVRVDLYDARGKARTSGGDEVRIWLRDASSSDDKKTSVAAEVTDLHNGSYLGETILQWAGPTSLRVSLTYPREFLRLVTRLQHTLFSMRWVTASFRNKTARISETTVCLPSSPVPGFAHTCNLTRENSGFPWYCGQPTDTRLTCRNWAGSNNLKYTPLPLSGEERKLVAKMDQKPCLRLIPTGVILNVTENGIRAKEKTLPPCWSLPAKTTWTRPAPWGWFQRGSWRPIDCSLPEVTTEYVQRCVRNTSILLQGDSNQRHWLDYIQEHTGCSGVVNANAWHAPRLCEVASLNSTLLFAPHAMPFAVGTHSDLHNLPLPEAIHKLPLRNNIVIVVHYYAHATTEGLYSYRHRVRNARKAIETFLDEVDRVQGRKVKVKVFIRGPHVQFESNLHHVHFGDRFAPQYIRIWKEEFKGLYDRVWFLSYWDMMLAAENMQCHPPKQIVLEKLKVFLGHFCEVPVDR